VIFARPIAIGSCKNRSTEYDRLPGSVKWARDTLCVHRM
jgi:hypothetical protein